MTEQDEKQRLIEQMGSRDNKTARTAVNELREYGWLKDGSLYHADLREAKLSGADLSRADLSYASLSNADLWEADLRYVNLSYANLNGVNLSGADLSGANLREADLSRADLNGVNLSGANLWEADLSRADLSRADLGGADLRGANLSEADLSEADLTEAECGGTVFGDVDLSAAKGLDTIEHDGPSTIGIDTLYNSKGKIPEVFLRGCGVPEILIIYLPALMEKAFDFYSCFISHNHTDKPLARRIYNHLQGEGIRCWLDEKELNPGDSIYDGVSHGIKVWDKTIVLFSEHALKSWWVDYEIDKAFQKERELMKQSGKKIHALIPLDLDGAVFSDEFRSGKIEEVTNSRLVANFQGWDKDNALFEREIARVIKALRTDEGKPPPPEPKLGKK